MRKAPMNIKGSFFGWVGLTKKNKNVKKWPEVVMRSFCQYWLGPHKLWVCQVIAHFEKTICSFSNGAISGENLFELIA